MQFAIKSLLSVLAVLPLLFSTALTAKENESQQFFTNAHIATIRVEITGTNLSALRNNNRLYVRGTVKDGTTIYQDVAIHLKGAAGSFRGVDDPNSGPALTLNFDKFNDHQKFHGLDKIHLNNSVQDPSYMSEIICGELFRAAGVPAARATHARVWLNGRDLGLYVLKEGFDKEFLRQYFPNARGNLYDGGFLRDITEPLQRNSGEEGRNVKAYADLKALTAAAQETNALLRMKRLEQVLDVDRFVSFVAMEIITWHWDGYALNRNNYRIYHDVSTDKMVFLPHGMDQMFWEANQPLLNVARIQGMVASRLLTTKEGKQRYLERATMLVTNVFQVESLTNKINELQQRIRPVLASISPAHASNHDGAVNNLRNQIIARARFLEKAVNVPPALAVRFGSNGMAQITDWRPLNTRKLAKIDKLSEGGKSLLHVNTLSDTNCTASWRSRVALQPGEYHFEALARTAAVVPLKDKKGEGAGIRISGVTIPRTNHLVGTSGWTRLQFDFDVKPGEDNERDLLCELRAFSGEAWFDVESVRLIRK